VDGYGETGIPGYYVKFKELVAYAKNLKE